MDPYLEDPAFWPDFHDSFVTYWRDAINSVLPPEYEARINERVQIVGRGDEAPRAFRPDVLVSRDDLRGGPRESPGPAIAATLAPVILPMVELDEARTTYIEIRRGPSREIVTVLELLSPSNKVGTDHVLYLYKRQEIFHQEIHLLELDLLLGGTRLPLGAPLPAGDYYAYLARADRRFTCDAYAWGLRHGLPTLPMPLRYPDPDLLIDLQAVFDTAYDRGRYARSLPYDRPPVAPVPDRHREWVAERVRAGRG
jgi:hypothetical protein